MDPIRLQPETVTRVRTAGAVESSLPREYVRLSNGRYTVYLCGTGSGVSQRGTWAVSRGAADDQFDAGGFHLYLRDVDAGGVWSAGYQPTRVPPQRYEFRAGQNFAEISRTDAEIESALSVCVAPEHDVELRCCRLTNLGNRRRRIEVTSCVEFVLWERDADSSHPATARE